MNDLDVTNDHYVSVNHDRIIFLRPPTVMTKDRALIMAAWIVVLADDNDEFADVVKRVRKT